MQNVIVCCVITAVLFYLGKRLRAAFARDSLSCAQGCGNCGGCRQDCSPCQPDSLPSAGQETDK